MITPAYRILQYRAFPCILCLCCNRVSYNPNDIREHFCGFCHRWLDDVPMDEAFSVAEGVRTSLILHDNDTQEDSP